MESEYKRQSQTEAQLVNEPSGTWGGSWTERKLLAFEKYVKAYLTILNNYRDKYNWKLVYFDGFAGSGSRIEEDKSECSNISLFNEDEIEEREEKLYQGAAERVLKLDIRGFDYYYFIERNPEALSKLETKLKSIPHKGLLAFRSEDANDEIKNLAKGFKDHPNLRGLVLLDPFGMQLDWSTLEQLKGCNIDLWILLPSGVIINRLLDRKGKLLFSDKLQKFFGLTEQEIREFFYEKKKEMTLFGEEEVTTKQQNAVHRIAELYTSRLKTLFTQVDDNPLILYNDHGVPIFHFVFASNNPTARKIAKEIVGKL